jgi:hypothetical protein
MSSTIYLYIKIHNKTGLKYLGKTIKSDVHKYKGSGQYWKKHIKKNGYDVSTYVIYQTQDPEQFEKVATFYSSIFNIVESKEWANFCMETGKGAGMIGSRNGMYGRTHTKEVKELLSEVAKKNFKGKSYEDLYGKEKAKELKLLRSKQSKYKNNSGSNNPRFDSTKYKFYNNETKDFFIGTRFSFQTEYSINRTGVHALIHKRKYKNWVLIGN